MLYTRSVAWVIACACFCWLQPAICDQTPATGIYQPLQRELVKREEFTKAFLHVFMTSNFSGEVIQKALQEILSAGHICIFGPACAPQETTLCDLLHLPENEWLRLQLALIKAQDAGGCKECASQQIELCKQEILALILEHLYRPPHAIANYQQTMFKGIGILNLNNIEGYFVCNEGYPSVGDDDKSGVASRFSSHCANLGSIRGPDGECLATRSGRATSTERMLECVVHACLEQLKSPSPKGMARRADGSIEFQHLITSYIHPAEKDTSFYLHTMMKAIDAWPDAGIPISINGTQVVLLRPIFQNQLFSTILTSMRSQQQNEPTRQDLTDYISFNGNQRLLERLILQEKLSLSKELLEASCKLDRLLLQPNGFISSIGVTGLIEWGRIPMHGLYLKQKQLFNHPIFKEYQQAVAQFLIQEYQSGLKQNRETVRALFALMFRKEITLARPRLSEELHTGDLDIYRNIVCERLHLSQGKQCKHGLDRTGIGIALVVAQHRYQRETGVLYLPSTGLIEKGSEEHLHFIRFKRHFRDALLHLAAPIGVESRGFYGVTSIEDDKPTQRKYLICREDLGFGVPPVKEEEIEIEDLLYQDLAEHGQKQYRGHLTEHFIFSIAGQHDKGTANSVKQALSKITPEIRMHVENRIKAILQKTNLDIQYPHSLLNNILELDIPLAELKLEETITPHCSRLQLLQQQLETIDFSLDEFGWYTRYALQMIVHLGLLD